MVELSRALPGTGRMTIGTLAAKMVRRFILCMAGLAIRLPLMIKTGVFPTAGIVAA